MGIGRRPEIVSHQISKAVEAMKTYVWKEAMMRFLLFLRFLPKKEEPQMKFTNNFKAATVERSKNLRF